MSKIRKPAQDGADRRSDRPAVRVAASLSGSRRQAAARSDDIHVVNDLHMPVNEDVLVNLKSTDVLHGFFLPNMRVKQDAVPGMMIPVWFRPVETGTYDLVCAELCGWGHYKMKGRLTSNARRVRRLARSRNTHERAGDAGQASARLRNNEERPHEHV